MMSNRSVLSCAIAALCLIILASAEAPHAETVAVSRSPPPEQLGGPLSQSHAASRDTDGWGSNESLNPSSIGGRGPGSSGESSRSNSQRQSQGSSGDSDRGGPLGEGRREGEERGPRWRGSYRQYRDEYSRIRQLVDVHEDEEREKDPKVKVLPLAATDPSVGDRNKGDPYIGEGSVSEFETLSAVPQARREIKTLAVLMDEQTATGCLGCRGGRPSPRGRFAFRRRLSRIAIPSPVAASPAPGGEAGGAGSSRAETVSPRVVAIQTALRKHPNAATSRIGKALMKLKSQRDAGHTLSLKEEKRKGKTVGLLNKKPQ